MDTISILAAGLLALVALLVLDLAAVMFGTDSRDLLMDDHRR